MTSSWGIDSGKFVVTDGTRTVATTDGTLVCLLSTLYEFPSQVVTFPDPPADYCYAWQGKQNYGFNPSPSVPDSYAQSQQARVLFTRLAQEYEDGITLMAAPDGADIFFGQLKLTRTSAPTHTWYGRTLQALQKQGEWIPWQGSGLMEAGLGIARALHLVIEGGNLKLVAEQSVGPPTGGVGPRSWGDYPSIWSIAQDKEGGDYQVLSSAGFIVWSDNASPYYKTASRIVNTDGTPGAFTTLRLGGSNPCTTTDPTNYQSVYSVDVRGWFGRRS